jgi:hypothetical protein
LAPSDLTARLQRRVARLLLRHDRHVFRGHFHEWYERSSLPRLPELQAYDYVMRLLLLSSELLDEIVPRIRRQMSFQTTRSTQEEEAPPRGQIDWNSSLARSWDERPGDPPTRFATRLRSRSFATPENALVSAVIEHCAQELAQTRAGRLFADAPLTGEEQRELAHLEDRLRREQAALYAHIDTGTASAPQEAEHDIAALVDSVEQHLPPGSSPYRDLLDWWQRFERLCLRGNSGATPAPVLHSSEHADLLYRLWLALELVEFLAGQHLLSSATVETDRLSFDFHWKGRTFRFNYQRAAMHDTLWQGVAEHRPLCCIRRADALQVEPDGRLIWREPGVLLESGLYAVSDTNTAADLLRQMLGSLQAHDTAKGMLVLPFPPPELARLAPNAYTNAIAPEHDLRCYELRPLEQIEILHERLHALLEQAAAWLPERPAVACRGMLQDADTVNPGTLPASHCIHCGALLALCPKPHVSPWRVDLVCPHCDCLRNVQLCHIMGTQPTIALLPPFVRRVLTREQLVTNVKQLRERVQVQYKVDDDSNEAELARTAVVHAIGELTESYLAWKQPDSLMAQIEEKLSWAFGSMWRADQHPRGLPEDVRNMLVSGEYVWNEFQQSDMRDWAACAVQYVRALERELHRRIYARCGKPSMLMYYDEPMNPHQFTFGTVSRAYRKRNDTAPDPNWQTMLQHVAQASQVDVAAFEELIADIARLRKNRNKIAHSERIDRGIAGTVRSAVLGQPDQAGLLRRFIELLDAASGGS